VCGEANYALRLAGELKATYAVDLFHESGYRPEVPDDFLCRDHRLFHRFAAARSYHGILYQMGNTYQEQRFVYESLRRYPGVVTLHDFCLSGFFWEWSRRADARSWPTSFSEEVRHFAPDTPGELAPAIARWHREPGGIPEACARRGIYLNRRIFEEAAHVVVHSRWCLEQAHRLFPEHAERVSLIPHGASLGDRSPAQRTAIRKRFGMPGDALVFGSFGILGRGKMNEESLHAFANVAHEFPRAMFLFVGPDFGQGATREAADALGLSDRVRVLGRLADTDYDDLLAVTDVGVNLRRPPTYGETSGSLLDLLRFGVPVVVTDTGSFSELPDAIVRKVRWGADGLAALTDAFRELARDHGLRARMGRAARQHIRQSHAWSSVGALYSEVIERNHARTRSRGSRECPATAVIHRAGRASVAPRASRTQGGRPR
jgi:glycosyltransferase involved in cell wall biosynthesis